MEVGAMRLCSTTLWLVVVFCVACLVHRSKGARWTHSVMLNPDYMVLWSLGPGSQEITFELQVRTLGYVGFGFSRDGRMAGSDMVVGWVDKGQIHFQDRHVKTSFGNALDREPEVDPKQDYQLLLGYENSTHTVLRFKRKFDTCDNHDVPITNDTMRIIWAYDKFEPAGGSVGPKSLPQHDSVSKGTQSLFLIQRADQAFPDPNETTRTWELRNPPVEPPAPGENLYWCRVFQVPALTRKHHLIRYEPIGTFTGSKGLQHVVLYECQTSAKVAKMAEEPGMQCFEHNAQELNCKQIVSSWAKGSVGFSFPPETGYPLDPTEAKYYLMETHFLAPTDESNAVLDGSGLRLFYTPQLRMHDAGVLSIGIEPNWRHLIPPGQQSVISSGHCVSQCTQQVFPKSGINMFAVVMKTNRIGKRVTLKHIRSDEELAPIATDENVDADYQEYRKIGNPVRIFPGDHLITECTYNSSGRSAITLGGLNAREETCLVMGLYYPRQKTMYACHSLPSLPTVLHSLGIEELIRGSNPVKIAAPPELAGMTLEARLVSYDWDHQFDAFQKVTTKGSFMPLCWTKSGLLPETDKEFHYPHISKPFYRNNIDECTYRRYSTEGRMGHIPVIEIEDNHIGNAARSKLPRSNTPAAEGSLGLSRFNSGVSVYTNVKTVVFLAMPIMLILFNR